MPANQFNDRSNGTVASVTMFDPATLKVVKAIKLAVQNPNAMEYDPDVNRTVGALAALTWNGFSSYHGLQVKLTKPVAWGLQALGSYTWSKNIDTSSSSVAGSTFGSSIAQLPFLDLRLTRGLSDFDIRHNVAISYTWQLPSPSPSLGAAAWPIRGWASGGIFQARSGVPFTPTIGGDPLGLNGSLTFAFPDRAPGCNPVNENFKQAPGGPRYINTSCFSFPASKLPGNTTVPRLLGNSGRNSVIGPGLVNFDLSLIKNNPVMRISECFNLQFQAQFFNVLNHPNLAPPLGGRTNIFNQSGNVLSSAGANADDFKAIAVCSEDCLVVRREKPSSETK